MRRCWVTNPGSGIVQWCEFRSQRLHAVLSGDLMQRNEIIARSIAVLTVSLSCAYTIRFMKTVQVAAAQVSSEQVIYLNQGWSKADRDTFYWISQGTVMMSYDIFQNLELADSRELFRSDANLERYGLIPSPPDPNGNPDGLPIGVTKQVTAEGRWKGTDAGINCAVCHVSELHYKGKTIHIDGNAGIHIDLQGLFRSGDDAMQAALHDPAKFDRLATKIGASSADAKSELRQRLEREAGRIHYYVGTIMVAPHVWGPGRMDALNLILNRRMTIA